ncbi:MATE family efflux transporter [uncultured Ruthenibacterium sp.]|uniref:MATE family efflux transporter n=1 Tax=uncultured Ruthenibacterium sp. TaxID=1905347 RepID=UPI00349EF5B2
MKQSNISRAAKQQALFQDISVWKAIAALAVPSVFSMLVMILYNMADMFFVGQLGDAAQVAAVSLVGPVFTLLMAVGSMLGGGGCALLAKTLGENRAESAKLYSSLAAWGSVVFGILFGTVMIVARHPLLQFLGVNNEIEPYAATYLSVLAFGAPVMIFSTAFGSIVRAEGAVKEGFLAHLLSTVTNMTLDPVFILTFRMGVGGAAIATVLGNVVGCVYLVFYILRRSANFTLSPFPSIRNPAALGSLLAIGLPNFINSTLVGFAHALANQLLIQYGTLAVAGMASASKTTMLISMTQMGITVGVQPLLAYNYGAKNILRIREAVSKLSLLTLGVGLFLTGICFMEGKQIVALFLKEPDALVLGQQFVRLLVLTGPFLGLYYLASSFLQASGNAKTATFVSLLRQGIFLIPLLYGMNALFGMYGNIAAHIAADLLAASVAAFLALRQYRMLKNNTSKEMH